MSTNRQPFQPLQRPVQYTKPVHQPLDHGYLIAFTHAENGEFDELQNFLTINALNLGVLYDDKSILNIITRNGCKVPIIKTLMQRYKASPHLRDNKQRTIMHEAVESDNLEVLKFALENENMDINAKDDRGKTPLHYALTAKKIPCEYNKKLDKNGDKYIIIQIEEECYRLNIGIIEYLFTHSPAYEALDEHNFSPIDYALNLNSPALLARLNQIPIFKMALDMREQGGHLNDNIYDYWITDEEKEMDFLLRQYMGTVPLPRASAFAGSKVNREFFKKLENIVIKILSRQDKNYKHEHIKLDNTEYAENLYKLKTLALKINIYDTRSTIVQYFDKIARAFVMTLDEMRDKYVRQNMNDSWLDDNKILDKLYKNEKLNVKFFENIGKKFNPRTYRFYSEIDKFDDNIETLRRIPYITPEAENMLTELNEAFEKLQNMLRLSNFNP